ncbi:MAG: hypothetical protein HXY37_05830 [Chloroflexi bacterium]|nr:hypothetical protein [Chloroflexota bacterium]
MRRAPLLLILALLTLGLLPAADLAAQGNQRCFPETGYCISGPIRRYWEQNGGLPVFGFPISPLQTETVENWTGPVQWFERDRLEDHTAQNQGVLAGRLGVEYLERQGRPWQFRPLGGQVPGCRAFAETGYYLCGGFRSFWERNGGLARFGFPVTDQISETIEGQTYTVQYFERRRMEYHPENRPPFDILLGLLGRDLRQATPPTPPPTPTPLPIPSQQILIDEPVEGATVSSPVRLQGRITRPVAGGSLQFRVVEPDGAELARGSFQVNGLSFSHAIAYTAPRGNNLMIELSEVDPGTGGVIARAQRAVRYAPTTAQQISIDQPASGSRVGTRVQLRGRTAIFPSEGDLIVSVFDGRGGLITTFSAVVRGLPGQPVDFAIDFDLPDQGGRLVTIEVADINARGDLLARAVTNVFAGTGYPAP